MHAVGLYPPPLRLSMNAGRLAVSHRNVQGTSSVKEVKGCGGNNRAGKERRDA
ncbi:hypothetical protein SGM_1934 [Streptomyces griseoaurantiacus M045]|uniref:Uncharacterized protein n=1 Tax=Streptomyces griseoaurantiacus M045 TaxID=996637 RepID=F3NFN5_9ACTN|nr:hypothetical protein SGM_1934 [Streptomyces griseoaurantiacus M045]